MGFMFVAGLLAGQTRPTTAPMAFLATPEDGFRMVVVAQREEEGVWEPLYALRNRSDGTDEYERVGLPHCFALSADALSALETAWEESMKDDGA